MRNICILGCFLAIVNISYGHSKVLSDWHLGVSYYGNNLFNPGAQVTGQKVFWERAKTKVKQDESVKIKYQQYLLDANVGFYYDNPTYWALFNNYVVQQRTAKEKEKYVSYGVGLGFMRTFMPETLVVAPNGGIPF